jgi:hypothetical protein
MFTFGIVYIIKDQERLVNVNSAFCLSSCLPRPCLQAVHG